MFVKGMYKPCLFAKRAIDEGEELAFDYGFAKEFEWLKDYNKKFNFGDDETEKTK